MELNNIYNLNCLDGMAKLNNKSINLRLEKNINEFNIHNIFHCSDLKYEEIKPLIDYYLSNTNNVIYSNTLIDFNDKYSNNILLFESKNNIKTNNNVEKLLYLMMNQIHFNEFEKLNKEEIEQYNFENL